MKRAFLGLIFSALTVSASAQERLTIVAPFSPGGPVDLLARLLADGWQKRGGQAVVVENLAGGAGNIGMEKVKRAKPDGKTLLVIPAGNLTINPTLMPNFPFQIEKDFAAITMLARAPNALVASTSSGIKTSRDLIERAKGKPGDLTYASPGIGSGLHLAGELFKQQAGVDITHVPYKGSTPALNDLLGGVVPLMFSNLPVLLPHIRSGKLVALGLTDTMRSPIANDIPTLAEQGIQGVNVSSWYGLLAPAGMPAAQLEKLAQEAHQILSEAGTPEKLSNQGLSLSPMKPSDFANHIRQETATWGQVIRSRKITME